MCVRPGHCLSQTFAKVIESWLAEGHSLRTGLWTLFGMRDVMPLEEGEISTFCRQLQDEFWKLESSLSLRPTYIHISLISEAEL